MTVKGRRHSAPLKLAARVVLHLTDRQVFEGCQQLMAKLAAVCQALHLARTLIPPLWTAASACLLACLIACLHPCIAIGWARKRRTANRTWGTQVL